jgi:hypothetical protein
MIKPKVKVLSDDAEKQVVELTHPESGEKFVIFYYGAKFDVNDEVAVRKLWQQQLERKAVGSGRE